MRKTELVVSGLDVTLVKKRKKNIHLYVKPPAGDVLVTAPMRASDREIRLFLESRLDWIHACREKMRNRPPKPKREYDSGESITLWGEKYIINVLPGAKRSGVQIHGTAIFLCISGDNTFERREKIILGLYRRELEKAVPGRLVFWEERMGLKAASWQLKKMRTKWGTCNISKRRIWLNVYLAEKAPQCLDYLIVHELCHLLERSHNAVFYGYMDKFMPGWREIRKSMTL